MTDSYLHSMMMAIIVAAHETTALASANALRQLLTHRAQWQAICDNPALIPAARDLFDRTQALAVQVEQVASLRELDLHGTPGEEVDMSPKFFTVVGDSPGQRVTVRQPAVVRKRMDGSVGDVIVKGIVD